MGTRGGAEAGSWVPVRRLRHWSEWDPWGPLMGGEGQVAARAGEAGSRVQGGSLGI